MNARSSRRTWALGLLAMGFEYLLEIEVRGGLDHPGQHLEDLPFRMIDVLQFVYEQIVQRCEAEASGSPCERCIGPPDRS